MKEVDVALIDCEDEWSNERKSNLDDLVSLPLGFPPSTLDLNPPSSFKIITFACFYQSVARTMEGRYVANERSARVSKFVPLLSSSFNV